MSSQRPPRRGLQAAAALALAALVLTGCNTSPMTTLDPAGTHAQNILDLLIPVAWAALGVFLVVEGILIYSVIKFRRRDDNAMPVQVHGNTRIEVMWTIAPALIVLVIAVLTFRTQAVNSAMPKDALRIVATGHQWWFRFDYPQQGVATASDMLIPVGRDVTVELHGEDVIHSFWVPRLAGKTDMIPNKTNYLTFRATEPGVFRGHCAEFCGEVHALMRFRVIAVEPAVFDRWIAAQRTDPVPPAGANPLAQSGTQVPVAPTAAAGAPTPAPAQAPAPTDPRARGQLVFLRKGCIGCHIINGVPQAVGRTGPNLTNLGSRYTLAGGTLQNTDENLASWLRDPGAIKPGNKMAGAVRPGTLTDQEIGDLVAYLNGMKLDVPLPADPDPIQYP
ncbi:MAG TPA: cytochrome c oxidase subunit II [Roseiflexaceae bacterium]|nr:cytochrome c oxidase subunit II [Roseiflexaceae bacterium]